MATLFDPIVVVRTLLNDPKLSQTLRPQLRQPAVKAVETVLKLKTFGIKHLQAFLETLGDEEFRLVIDSVSDTVTRIVIKRIDPHHPMAAGAAKNLDAEWARQHLVALTLGEAVPFEKPEPLDKLLPAKKRTLDHFGALVEELGPDSFVQSLFATSPKGRCSLIKKLNAKHPKAKGPAAKIDPEWAFQQLVEIAEIELPEVEQESSESGAQWFARLQMIYSTRPTR